MADSEAEMETVVFKRVQDPEVSNLQLELSCFSLGLGSFEFNQTEKMFWFLMELLLQDLT